MTFLPKRNEMLSLKVNKEEKAELKATSKTVGKAVQKILLIAGTQRSKETSLSMEPQTEQEATRSRKSYYTL